MVEPERKHRGGRFRSPRGFTLIEILVVVAIIALLISILLPSLSRARDQARSVACSANLGQLARAETVYQTQNKEWIPGSPHTTGYVYLKTGSTVYGSNTPGFNRLSLNLSDWNTPLRAVMFSPSSLPRGTGGNWQTTQIQMWSKIFEGVFACPNNPETYGPFNAAGFPIIRSASYLTMSSFMSAGQDFPTQSVSSSVPPHAYKTIFEMQNPHGYRPRHSRLVRESMKIFLADGFRFYDGTTKDYAPSTIGSWSSFSASNPPALGGTNAREWGISRKYSYRHRGQRAINAGFFDGHAEQLFVDFKGLNEDEVGYAGTAVDPRYSYPTGTKVTSSNKDVLHKYKGAPFAAGSELSLP